MIKNKSITSIIAAAVMFVATACNKNDSLTSTASALTSETSGTSGNIAVSVTSTGDTVYVVNSCNKNQQRDSIAFTGLPANALTYLESSYAGYTGTKAYAIKDASGTVAGYVAIIQYNGNPIGVGFDATGAFVKVLEQREGHDFGNGGWHRGGRFDDRGGKKDSIALSALPSAIVDYFSTNYSTDTLIKAFTNKDSSIVVVSTNGSLFSTVFSASGTFIKRAQLLNHRGSYAAIAVDALPSAAQSYLTTTYPNYVYKQGFKIVSNGTVKGYIVVIDENVSNKVELINKLEG